MAKVGFITAIVSFIIGTYLFIEFMATQQWYFALIGLYYVLVAIPFNFLVAFLVAIDSQGKARKNTLIIMFSNIPIALVYLFFAMRLIQKLDV
jgi:hypothetical protein